MSDNQAVAACLLCGKKCFGIYDLYDDRYGYPGIFPLAECISCGHKMLQCSMSQDQLAHLYTNYYPRASFNLDDYKPHQEVAGFHAWLEGAYRAAFRWVPKNVRVLDIGCGFGETLGYHRARGCDVYGVEADENVRKVAEHFGFPIHIGLFEPALYAPDFFDYVTMDQVMEHMIDPVVTLQGVARVLKPGGAAIVSVPQADGWGAKTFGRRWINWHAPYHLHHFSIQSMRIAAEKAGLTVEAVKTITSSDWLHLQWSHLLMFPQEAEPSPFWCPRGKRSIGQERMQKFFQCLHAMKINHVITRFFDAIGKGDNQVFFLRKP